MNGFLLFHIFTLWTVSSHFTFYSMNGLHLFHIFTLWMACTYFLLIPDREQLDPLLSGYPVNSLQVTWQWCVLRLLCINTKRTTPYTHNYPAPVFLQQCSQWFNYDMIDGNLSKNLKGSDWHWPRALAISSWIEVETFLCPREVKLFCWLFNGTQPLWKVNKVRYVIQ